jgi:glycosyltransferase involved in cell wall biosynthesis
MKVLIITYYWPPSGGSGVQRWLKFVKYLPSFGITPYVFTPENPSFDVRDESLLKDVPAEAEVIHFPIWEPYKLGQRISAKPGTSNTHSRDTGNSFLKNVTTWLRGNLLFPDPRIFWVKPSVQFLEGFLKDNDIKTVITTGPPHSVHMIGFRLKKKIPTLKWIADFRDPWSEWGILSSFKLTAWARKIHRRMERQVLTTADKVITITPFYVKQLERLSGRKVDLITNGFDEVDFAHISVRVTKKFMIRHIGLVNPSCDPKPFMKAMRDLALGDSDFANHVEINFTGNINEEFKQFVLADGILARITTFSHSVPHSELIGLYENSSALLLVLTGYKDGEGFLPGKLFEYLATGIPIIAVGPVPSDANELLRELNSGEMIESGNSEMIKQRVLTLYQDWKSGPAHKNNDLATQYSRKELTFKLVELLRTV